LFVIPAQAGTAPTRGQERVAYLRKKYKKDQNGL